MGVRAQTQQGKQRVGMQSQRSAWGPPGAGDLFVITERPILRVWSSGIAGDLGKTGPGPLIANKSVTDSKAKFLLVIYP